MDKKELRKIVGDVRKQNSIFSNKSFLDNLMVPNSIVGRESESKKLVDYLLSYEKGLVVPLVSIYGRSGSGKSTIVQFVCENLDLDFCYVNFRKAKTVFGCVNLILSEMGHPNLKNAQGINSAFLILERLIKETLEKSGNSLFVLCLDEFDTLFYDKRGKPSDFVYKLVVLVEKLRALKKHMCIVTISNKVLSEFNLDDRVISRIGASEIYFDSYSQSDVLKIIRNRAKKSFLKKIDDDVLQHCANISSEEHGDARRAIDLLRTSGEIAGIENKKISKRHIDEAVSQLQKNQITTIISGGSYHFRLACAALSRLTYVNDEGWHSTSDLFKQYQQIISSDTRQISYRRFSEMLVELVNSGIAVSKTESRGRHGYGSQFKLSVDPDLIGNSCFPDWWPSVVESKKRKDDAIRSMKALKSLSFGRRRSRFGNLYGDLGL
ncbi:Cdc6/Cdc18 family protein [Nitrosopumilus adriaticus]|uniref:ORC1-type DNA replication protein n=1 Tax=Nitrosopumilus adriaticus TaxID=1580092 RepID=A0A0D5BZC7_9ARCH|nr:AAA family ATPase [Nitrosopumilus adriaticus]AJW69894.1 ORC1-type DNA replication protein [Nitrosopumilus adriaticus]